MAELAREPGGGGGAGEGKRKSKFGVGFWIILFFAFLKDVTDLLFNLSVVLSPATVVTGFVMNPVVGLYLWAVGVRPTATKVATFGVSFIIDAFPGTSFIPATTLNLLFIRYLENSERARAIAGTADMLASSGVGPKKASVGEAANDDRYRQAA